MAAYTSTQAGDWNTDATWGGGGHPVSGDTCTIAHAVTVGSNAAVGTSPSNATTYSTTISGSGSLTINTGFTLTLKGSVLISAQNASAITMQAGSHIILDPSAATTRASAMYRIVFSGTGVGAGMVINGSIGSHCTVTTYRPNGDEAYGNFAVMASAYQAIKTATYCDFSNLGDATYLAIQQYALVDGSSPSITHCTFDNCAGVRYYTDGNVTGNPVYSYNKHLNSRYTTVGSNNICFWWSTSGALTTGSRTCTYNSFDVLTGFSPPLGLTITNNYFGKAPVMLTGGAWATFSNNFIYNVTASGFSIEGVLSNCYLLMGYSSNNHCLQMLAYDMNMTVDASIFECSTNDTVGDYIYCGGNPGSARVATITNSILLPQTTGVSPGDFISCLYGANATYSVSHNTFVSTGHGETGIHYGETYAGRAGMFSLMSSNIAWTPAGKTAGVLLTRNPAGTIQNVVTPANCTCNIGYGLDTGLDGYGFRSGDPADSNMFDTVPNTPVITSANPGFVDSTRCLAKWSAYMGQAETVVAALALLDDVDVYTTRISDCITWVKHGFAPTNQTLKGAGHDAVDIGAVLVVPTAPTGLIATAGDNTVNLDWDDTSGATGYVIYRSLTIGGPYSQLDTSVLSTYDDNTALNATTYYYVVSATGTGGEGPSSSEVNATPTGGAALLVHSGMSGGMKDLTGCIYT